jgi:hypothetical protein
MTEYRGYEITFRKNNKIAAVRKIGSLFAAKIISRDKSNDKEWLIAEAKVFVDTDLKIN